MTGYTLQQSLRTQERIMNTWGFFKWQLEDREYLVHIKFIPSRKKKLSVNEQVFLKKSADQIPRYFLTKIVDKSVTRQLWNGCDPRRGPSLGWCTSTQSRDYAYVHIYRASHSLDTIYHLISPGKHVYSGPHLVRGSEEKQTSQRPGKN